MARLFVTPRELDFFSDIAKELIKDINDQKVYYYAVSPERSPASNVYGEVVKKVCDDPVELEVLCDVPEWETRADEFSAERVAKLAFYVQYRDALDRGVTLTVGDFFSYGAVFYEIVSVNPIKPIAGQVEHVDGYVVNGVLARSTVVDQIVANGPTGEHHTSDGAVRTKFVQQRGYAESELGETADARDLRRRGVLDAPLSGQRQVSWRGTASGAAESFYDE